MPRQLICCGARAGSLKPLRVTNERSRWSRTTASADSWSGELREVQPPEALQKQDESSVFDFRRQPLRSFILYSIDLYAPRTLDMYGITVHTEITKD
jgi:hypothetical protein